MLERMYAQFVTGIAVLAESVGDGVVEHRDGVTVTAVGRGHEEFNTAWVTSVPDDLAATIAWACGLLRESGRPWHVQVPESLGIDVAGLLRRHRLRVVERVPAMALTLGGGTPPERPSGLTLRRVQDRLELGRLRHAMSIGFGGPGAASDPAEWAITDTLLDDDRVALFTGYVDGHDEPVATSVAVSQDATTGVYGITTTDGFRRRGFGTAVTWAAVEAGREAGSSIAVLQATEMGAPVYERMGFETATWYDRLGPAG